VAVDGAANLVAGLRFAKSCAFKSAVPDVSDDGTCLGLASRAEVIFAGLGASAPLVKKGELAVDGAFLVVADTLLS